MNAIQTSSLTKYYGKSRGVIDLGLSVEEGDFFGFIGPNGAGKSTTIRMLLGPGGDIWQGCDAAERGDPFAGWIYAVRGGVLSVHEGEGGNPPFGKA